MQLFDDDDTVHLVIGEDEGSKNSDSLKAEVESGKDDVRLLWQGASHNLQ